MKRFFCLLFVLIIFPFTVLSETIDPIVGCWYMFIDVNDTSQELIDSGYKYSAILLLFTEDNLILFNETDFTASSGESRTPQKMGKWEKDNDKYIVSIISVGINEAYLKDQILFACLFNKDQYCVLRKMEQFNVYTDFLRK